MCLYPERKANRIILFTLVLGLITLLPMDAQVPSKEAQFVERITIKYEEGLFFLLSRKSLRKVIPRSDELPDLQNPLSGFWYELHASDGSVLYRRLVANPIRNIFEGPTDMDNPNPDEAPDRIESIPRSQEFTLLIPRPPTNAKLVLFSSPLEEDTVAQPASELARLPLDSIIPKK